MNIEDSKLSENNKEKVSDNLEKNKFKAEKSAEDLFGDEQTFPFVAGLGKNAAH